MIGIRKIAFDFLPERNRKELRSELETLTSSPDLVYYKIDTRDQFIASIRRFENESNPIVIQIIAHGNCEGFGVDQYNIVRYSEIADVLRQINRATNNRLVLNLVTVCYSLYQLSFFNQGSEKLYSLLIGSTKGAFVHGAITQSILFNQTPFDHLTRRMDEVNGNLNDDFLLQNHETYTYWIDA